MDDRIILEGLLSRDETALSEISRLYGRLIYSVAFRILGSAEDSEECVSDALLRIWNAIPPLEPTSLKSFAALTAKSAALNRYRASHASKRGETIPLEELYELSSDELDDTLSARELSREINRFLGLCTREERYIFLRRYLYAQDSGELASELGLTRAGVNLKLHRIRKRLKKHLFERGLL